MIEATTKIGDKVCGISADYSAGYKKRDTIFRINEQLHIHGFGVHGQCFALALTFCEKTSENETCAPTREKTDLTKVCHGRAECLDVRVKRGYHLTFRFNMMHDGGARNMAASVCLF